MTTVAIPAQARTLNDLFKRARRRSLILKAHDGHRYLLAPMDEWKAFKVGEDITQNKELMDFLAERRTGGPTVSLKQLKAELGIR